MLKILNSACRTTLETNTRRRKLYSINKSVSNFKKFIAHYFFKLLYFNNDSLNVGNEISCTLNKYKLIMNKNFEGDKHARKFLLHMIIFN